DRGDPGQPEFRRRAAASPAAAVLGGDRPGAAPGRGHLGGPLDHLLRGERGDRRPAGAVGVGRRGRRGHDGGGAGAHPPAGLTPGTRTSRPARAGRDVADTYGTRDQPICVPVADRASVTGWKKVVPPEEQSPLPPEVRPTALLPEKSEPPLSPGSAHTSVWI